MQSYRRSAPVDQAMDQQTSSGQVVPGIGSHQYASTANVSAPDPLTRAFNEAVKPYLDQIDSLKIQLDEMNLQVQQLEDERADFHAWIDKRGLRPDLPANLTASLPASPLSASTLSHQLDRKMTMLNYDLHRLADSLPSPLPTATIATPLSTLLPPILYLSTLPTGAALAFEHLMKLGGNLNSHHQISSSGQQSINDDDMGGQEGNDPEKAHLSDYEAVNARDQADFYTRLDEAMMEVIRRRMEQGTAGEENASAGAGWQIKRDIKRMENTSGYLRTEMGLRNYFSGSLDVMRRNEARNSTSGSAPGGNRTAGRMPPGGDGAGLTRYSP
ncbi:hypothetical protein MMC09_003432 [Bachmanniomyces sp. S44760]|nr:hypothetical protein [Bachmanniomyces sp. S44760]